MKTLARLTLVIAFIHSLTGGIFVTAGHSAEAKTKRVLAVTQSVGFLHGSVKRTGGELSVAEKALEEVGKESGVFEVVASQEAAKVITAENLKEFDAVFFYTTGELPLSGEQKEALLSFVKSGKGFIGAHSATDTYAGYSGYYEMINGTFDGHPWGAGTTVTITNHESAHPVVAMFDSEFQFKDEIYQYKNYKPEAVRVLLSLNMAKTNPKMPYHVPVAWVREFGQGRLFYTNLGHNEGTWQNPKFRQHLLAGIRWATKLDHGPAAPNPRVQAVEQLKGFLVVAAPEVNKNADELLAKASKKKDPEYLPHLVEHLNEFKTVFKGKDAAKRKELLEEIINHID